MATSDDRGTIRLDERLDFWGAQEVPVVRNFVASQASLAGLDDERLADLRLAVTELATNCVRHGNGGGTVRIRVRGCENELVCEVTSRGGSIDPHAGLSRPPAGAGNGWGLYLVSVVTDDTEISSDQGLNVVRIRTALH